MVENDKKTGRDKPDGSQGNEWPRLAEVLEIDQMTDYAKCYEVQREAVREVEEDVQRDDRLVESNVSRSFAGVAASRLGTRYSRRSRVARQALRTSSSPLSVLRCTEGRMLLRRQVSGDVLATTGKLRRTQRQCRKQKGQCAARPADRQQQREHRDPCDPRDKSRRIGPSRS